MHIHIYIYIYYHYAIQNIMYITMYIVIGGRVVGHRGGIQQGTQVHTNPALVQFGKMRPTCWWPVACA